MKVKSPFLFGVYVQTFQHKILQ